MKSTFSFSRPRGIQGTYTVTITLALLPTEVAVVSAAQSCPEDNDGNHQYPQQRLIKAEESHEAAGDTRTEIYRINRVVLGDSITLDTHGGYPVPTQRLVCTATLKGFTIKRVVYHRDITMWLSDCSTSSFAFVDADAQETKDHAVLPTVELQIVKIRQGFQTHRLVVRGAASDQETQTLLAEIQALAPPQLLPARLT